METYQLLKELCDLAAPSGRERSAAETLTRLLDGRFDRMETDPLGNLLVEKRAARADAPTLLLDAHMDLSQSRRRGPADFDGKRGAGTRAGDGARRGHLYAAAPLDRGGAEKSTCCEGALY